MTENTSSNINTQKKRDYSQAELDENKFIYDQFDPNYVRQMNNSLFKIVEEAYFRPVYVGFEEMPKRNNPAHPIILASNHSGMAFPWDAMVFGSGLYQICETQKERHIKALTAPALSETKLMNPYMIPDFWKFIF